MVRGASNGRVSCCSSSAARASFTVDGPRAATPLTIEVSSLNGDGESGRGRDWGRTDHGVRSSDSRGSVESVWRISRSSETPSISEWWTLT